jgi:hypothetical protein
MLPQGLKNANLEQGANVHKLSSRRADAKFFSFSLVDLERDVKIRYEKLVFRAGDANSAVAQW